MKKSCTGTQTQTSRTMTETLCISSTQKVKLFLTILMVISFLQATTAIEFSLDSPDKANLDEQFKISISSSESTLSDVKAFVEKDTKDFSEIYYNDKWNSPRNYIKSAFPEQTEFTIISHFSGETKVCARLRESGKTTFTEICNDIEIISNPEKTENIQEEEPYGSDNKNDNKYEKKTQPPIINKSKPINNPTTKETLEPIILNSPIELSSNTQNKEIPTINKNKLYILYGFTTFLAILVILLALNKL